MDPRGDDLGSHRCAGEWIASELMKRAVKLLTHSMVYEVPPQDLSVSASRIPAQPKSRMVIRRVGRLERET